MYVCITGEPVIGSGGYHPVMGAFRNLNFIIVQQEFQSDILNCRLADLSEILKFWLTYFCAYCNMILKAGNLSACQSVDIRCCARVQCLMSFEWV